MAQPEVVMGSLGRNWTFTGLVHFNLDIREECKERLLIKSGKLIRSENDWFHDFLGLILADEFLHWLHFADLLLCLFALVRVRLLLCCVLPVALVYPVESQGGAGIDH